jgi:hypothetical protein
MRLRPGAQHFVPAEWLFVLEERFSVPERASSVSLGIGSGSLRRLLAGDLDLKVEYLTRLARLLRIPAADLLAAGCPEANAAPRHGLADWLGPAEPTAPTVPTAAPPAPPSPEELQAMVRAASRVPPGCQPFR